MLHSLSELVGCGDPGVPVHGYKLGKNYWAGQLVTIACDTGYHLEGPTNRLCLHNGNWSEVMPTCKTLFFYLHGQRLNTTSFQRNELSHPGKCVSS